MTGAARRKAEEDCSDDERSILRRMSPVVARLRHANGL